MRICSRKGLGTRLGLEEPGRGGKRGGVSDTDERWAGEKRSGIEGMYSPMVGWLRDVRGEGVEAAGMSPSSSKSSSESPAVGVCGGSHKF